jgi:hypothetical protein
VEEADLFLAPLGVKGMTWGNSGAVGNLLGEKGNHLGLIVNFLVIISCPSQELGKIKVGQIKVMDHGSMILSDYLDWIE